MSCSIVSKILQGLILCCVLGCAGSTQAILGSIKLALPGKDVTLDPSLLREDYRYLRVTVKDGGAALLVLGYQDKDHNRDGRLTEVWYSADMEVLRLRAGRLAGLTGTHIEWKKVKYPGVPEWEKVGNKAPFSQSGVVISDVSETFSKIFYTQKIQTPKKSRLLGVDPYSLVWFADFTLGTNHLSAIYALKSTADGFQPVYGEQCLSKDFCITWQYWNAETANSL